MFAPLSGSAPGLRIPARLRRPDGGELAWTAAQAREWEALQAEGDPEFLASSLLGFAQALETNDPEAAASVYTLFQEAPHSLPMGALALQRLSDLEGRGRFGASLDFHLRRFFQESTDVSMLLGMTAAGLASQTFRFTTLSRLLSATETSFLTRGRGAYWAANSVGFVAEVPALVFAELGTRWVLGATQELPISVGLSLRQTAVQLSFLKLAGAVGRPYVASPLARQASLLGGITFANAAQTAFGWKAPQGGAALLFEALGTLGQFHVGTHLSRRLLGARFAGMWGALEMRSRAREIFSAEPVWARLGPPSPAALLQDSSLHFSVQLRLREKLGEALGKSGASESVNHLAQEIHKIPQPDQSVYADLLLETIPRLRGRSEPDPVERMICGAAACFSYVEALNPLQRASGSFLDSLIQEAFQRSLAERNGPALGSLIRAVTVQPGVLGLQKFYRDQGWHSRYGLELLRSSAGEPLPALWERALRAIPAPATSEPRGSGLEFSRRMLGDYFRAYHANKVPAEWRAPSRNYLIAAEGEAAPSRHPMDFPILARGLNHLVRLVQEAPAWGGVLSQVTELARHSPVPMLHLDRLFKILATDGPLEKIGDLAFPQNFYWNSWRLPRGQVAGPEALDRISEGMNAGFATGFVNDLPFSRKLTRFYEEFPALLESAGALRRRQEFHERAVELLRARSDARARSVFGSAKGNLTPLDFMALLGVHPTFTANRARETFAQGGLELRLMPYGRVQELWALQEQSQISRASPLSLFLPSSKSPTGRPWVVIAEVSPFASLEERAAVPCSSPHGFCMNMNTSPITKSCLFSIGKD